jgi:pimeloyl-ACP methyl ester carboxylesterase
MKKIIFITILLAGWSLHIFSQIDTSRIEYKENPMLRGIHHIIIDHENIEIIDLDDPAGPIQPIDDPPINENCTLKRLVFFVHGLGGSQGSWERASLALELPSQQGQLFSARYCKTFRPGYYGQYSDLLTPALDLGQYIATQAFLYSQMSGFNPDPEKNFIIAHSQGGVIARTLLRLDAEQGYKYGYGGLVTVASSLQGAMILNNKPCLLAFINSACTEMLAGPVSEAIPATPSSFLNSLLLGLGKQIVNGTCDVVTTLVPEVMSEFDAPMASDFKVWASHIDDLNNWAHTDAQSITPIHRYMPKVAFYGIEPNDNLIWRTFNWMVYNPNDENSWEANDDFKLLDQKVKPLRESYFNKSEHYKNQASIINASFWSWTNANQKDIVAYNKKSNAWKQGYLWIDLANDGWLSIIGAKTEVPAGTFCRCYCGALSYYPPLKVVDALNCDDCLQLCIPYPLLSADPLTKLVWTIKESDGIVLAESAQDLPYATRVPVRLRGIETDPQNWTGSSHMQIRNDEALRENLTKLLDGDYGNFFKLTPQ